MSKELLISLGALGSGTVLIGAIFYKGMKNVYELGLKEGRELGEMIGEIKAYSKILNAQEKKNKKKSRF